MPEDYSFRVDAATVVHHNRLHNRVVCEITLEITALHITGSQLQLLVSAVKKQFLALTYLDLVGARPRVLAASREFSRCNTSPHSIPCSSKIPFVCN
jgi:hypothetical protein